MERIKASVLLHGLTPDSMMFGEAEVSLVTTDSREVCPGCIFVSCRQKKSAFSVLNTSSNPFPAQARSPFTFQLMNFIPFLILRIAITSGDRPTLPGRHRRKSLRQQI